MICENCKWEADNVKTGINTHNQLRRSNEKWIAYGATHTPLGHAACKGGTQCMCQHKDVGSVVIRVD